MLRVLLTVIIPLLLPTAIYAGWLWLARPDAPPRSLWPWVWVGGAGVVLLAIVLFVVEIQFGSAQTGTYVPPRWENGTVIPGHVEPAPK